MMSLVENATPAKETDMKTLKNVSQFCTSYPQESTYDELKSMLKAGHTIGTYTYGGETQVEIRRIKNGYHGRQMVRVACFKE